MNYDIYKALVNDILQSAHPNAPYDNELYFSYTKLNRSRMNRWDKQLVLNDTLVASLKAISRPQFWIIITEPWCGDAAHIVPFLVRMAEVNPLVSYDIQLRDAEPFLIHQYLNDGTKGIPKLIVRDEQHKDLFFWGPRPKGAADIMRAMTEAKADFETIKIALQNWYNEDKGQSLLGELTSLFALHDSCFSVDLK